MTSSTDPHAVPTVTAPTSREPNPETIKQGRDPLKEFSGWLILLIFLVLFLYPPATVIGVVLAVLDFPWSTTTEAAVYSTLVVITIEVALGCFAVYAGLKLLKIKPRAVRTAKIFLAGVFVFNLAMFVLSLVVEHRASIKLNSSVDAEGRNVVFALIWYVYLELSKQVAATYAARKA